MVNNESSSMSLSNDGSPGWLEQRIERRFAKKCTLALFDTAVASRNLGDEIIMDAVNQQLRSIFSDIFFYRVATHDVLSLQSLLRVRQSALAVVGGTNCLSPTLLRRSIWRLRFRDTLILNNLVLLAAGWKGYQEHVGWLTRYACRSVLASNYLHSVRDEYTRSKLLQMGIDNVTNTGCVTMWNFTDNFLDGISTERSKYVVTTLNESVRSSSDLRFIELLTKRYERVYLWPQGVDDLQYAKNSFGSSLEILPQSLSAYDDFLNDEEISVDYIGLRLHGGVRALQNGRHALVVAVDNRAREIGKDTGLPFCDRSDFAAIDHFIENPERPSIKMPWSEIDRWKNQFSTLASPLCE